MKTQESEFLVKLMLILDLESLGLLWKDENFGYILYIYMMYIIWSICIYPQLRIMYVHVCIHVYIQIYRYTHIYIHILVYTLTHTYDVELRISKLLSRVCQSIRTSTINTCLLLTTLQKLKTGVFKVVHSCDSSCFIVNVFITVKFSIFLMFNVHSFLSLWI